MDKSISESTCVAPAHSKGNKSEFRKAFSLEPDTSQRRKKYRKKKSQKAPLSSIWSNMFHSSGNNKHLLEKVSEHKTREDYSSSSSSSSDAESVNSVLSSNSFSYVVASKTLFSKGKPKHVKKGRRIPVEESPKNQKKGLGGTLSRLGAKMGLKAKYNLQSCESLQNVASNTENKEENIQYENSKSRSRSKSRKAPAPPVAVDSSNDCTLPRKKYPLQRIPGAPIKDEDDYVTDDRVRLRYLAQLPEPEDNPFMPYRVGFKELKYDGTLSLFANHQGHRKKFHGGEYDISSTDDLLDRSASMERRRTHVKGKKKAPPPPNPFEEEISNSRRKESGEKVVVRNPSVDKTKRESITSQNEPQQCTGTTTTAQNCAPIQSVNANNSRSENYKESSSVCYARPAEKRKSETSTTVYSLLARKIDDGEVEKTDNGNKKTDNAQLLSVSTSNVIDRDESKVTDIQKKDNENSTKDKRTSTKDKIEQIKQEISKVGAPENKPEEEIAITVAQNVRQAPVVELGGITEKVELKENTEKVETKKNAEKVETKEKGEKKRQTELKLQTTTEYTPPLEQKKITSPKSPKKFPYFGFTPLQMLSNGYSGKMFTKKPDIESPKKQNKLWFKRSSYYGGAAEHLPSRSESKSPYQNLTRFTDIDKEAARIIEENKRKSAEIQYSDSANQLIALYSKYGETRCKPVAETGDKKLQAQADVLSSSSGIKSNAPNSSKICTPDAQTVFTNKIDIPVSVNDVKTTLPSPTSTNLSKSKVTTVSSIPLDTTNAQYTSEVQASTPKTISELITGKPPVVPVVKSGPEVQLEQPSTSTTTKRETEVQTSGITNTRRPSWSSNNNGLLDENKKLLAIVQPQAKMPATKPVANDDLPKLENKSEQSNYTPEWSCPRCTLVNPSWRNTCEACYHNRRQDPIISAAAMLEKVKKEVPPENANVVQASNTNNNSSTVEVRKISQDGITSTKISMPSITELQVRQAVVANKSCENLLSLFPDKDKLTKGEKLEGLKLIEDPAAEELDIQQLRDARLAFFSKENKSDIEERQDEKSKILNVEKKTFKDSESDEIDELLLAGIHNSSKNNLKGECNSEDRCDRIRKMSEVLSSICGPGNAQLLSNLNRIYENGDTSESCKTDQASWTNTFMHIQNEMQKKVEESSKELKDVDSSSDSGDNNKMERRRPSSRQLTYEEYRRLGAVPKGYGVGTNKPKGDKS